MNDAPEAGIINDLGGYPTITADVLVEATKPAERPTSRPGGTQSSSYCGARISMPRDPERDR